MSYFKVQPNKTRVLSPVQMLPESEKTPNWYIDNLRFMGGFYNLPLKSHYSIEASGIDRSQQATDQYQNSPVQTYLRLMLYYLGRQPNLDFNHLDKNVTTTNLLPNWQKGHKIFNLISFMKDSMTKLLQNTEFSVKSMSEMAVSDRKKVLDYLMIQFEMQGVFDKITDTYGLDIDFANGQRFEFEEELSDYMQNGGYKDEDAEIQTMLASHFWYSNNSISKFLQAFSHAAITGLTGVEHYVYNGKQCFDLIMPHQLIVDRRIDDDYNRYARFVGVIRPFTVEEILERWPNTNPEQVEDLRKMAASNISGNMYNTSNISWWNYGDEYTGNMINTLTGYWLTYRNLGKKRYQNEYGIQKMKKASAKEMGDDSICDVAKGTLIGNAFLANTGYINNVAEDFYNKSRPLLPVRVFMPNMLLGESRSVVSRLHELQDERDLYKFKIKEMIGKSKGRVVLIRGDKLGNGTTVKELEEDLTSLGLTVVTSSGEVEGDNSGLVVEPIDLTLDPNVTALFQIIAQIDREMEEIANISRISLGQQQTYIGLGTQENVMENASGSTYLYSGFMDFIQMNIQYAVDVAKNLATEDEGDYYQALIGKRGVEYLKVAKRIRYNNPLVFLRINDIIDEKAKQRLIQIAQALAQNQVIDMLDFIKIETAKTYYEIKNYLEYSLKKKEKKAEQVAAMQQMLSQIGDQNAQLAAQGNVLAQEGAAIQRQTMQPVQ